MDGEFQSMIPGRTKNTNSRLVKGCPCYKVFGDEKICVNDDDVLPIRAISVDPSFFNQVKGYEDLSDFKSDKDNMCYLLIYLDKEENFVYCVSRGMRLHINNKEVKASDIRAALTFVSSHEYAADGVVCSTCLYKYLVTLGDVFENRITASERAEMIERYVKELYVKMAIELGGGDSEGVEISDDTYSTLIRKQIENLSEQRSMLTESRIELRKNENIALHLELIDNYSQIYRLESVFLLQVMSLKESSEQFVAIGLLKFMIELSEQVIQINDRIREITMKLRKDEHPSNMIMDIISRYENHRKRSEQRFANLIQLLSQVVG